MQCSKIVYQTEREIKLYCKHIHEKKKHCIYKVVCGVRRAYCIPKVLTHYKIQLRLSQCPLFCAISDFMFFIVTRVMLSPYCVKRDIQMLRNCFNKKPSWVVLGPRSAEALFSFSTRLIFKCLAQCDGFTPSSICISGPMVRSGRGSLSGVVAPRFMKPVTFSLGSCLLF